MPKRYIDQAVFSCSEIENFFRTYGMETDHWPQVIPTEEMIEEMVDFDLDLARRHALLKKHGYNIPVSLE